jgi:hypothetical protein
MSYPEFRSELKKWAKLDQEQNKYQKVLYNIKNQKTEIKPKLINYMNKSKQNTLPLNSKYDVKLKETNQYSFISKSHIYNTLKKYIKNDHQLDMIINDIYESRNKSINYDINIAKKL